MFCDKCGHQINEDCKFCPNCGNKIQKLKRTGSQNSKRCMLVILGGAILALLVMLGINWKRSELTENKEKHVKEETQKECAYQYLACVQNESMKYGFINEKGEEVIKCQFDVEGSFEHFQGRLAPVGKKVGVTEDGTIKYKWGFINKSGEMVIPYQFDSVGGAGVTDTLTPVAKQENVQGVTKYKWGFIDKTGKLIIPYEYTNYLEEVSTVLDNKNLIGVQKEIVEKGVTTYKWGFINEKNEIVIEFLYDAVSSFSKEGIAAAEKNGKCGYINRKGKEVIPFQFQIAGTPGNDGKSIILDENDKWGVSNEKGDVIFWENQEREITFGDDYFMENGVAKIARKEINGTVYVGLINEAGKEIVPCEYQLIKDVDIHGYMTVAKKQGERILYGLMDSDGEMVIPLQYDMMSGFGDSGWSTAGTKRSPNSEEYSWKFIDEGNHTVLELPDKYIYVWGFIKVK